MKSGKKKVPFGGCLLIYMTVMFTVIFVALALWWHYLSCYESARVAGVMDAYMTRTLSEQLQEEMYAYSIACKTEYQSEEEVYEVLSEALSGDDWHYEKDAEKSTQEHPVFTLYRGETSVGEIALMPEAGDSLHMGFESWQSPRATFDFAQFGSTVTITAPYGCKVYVNGLEISEDEVEETSGIYPQLQAYEELIAEPNQLLVYRLDEVFTELAVEFTEGHAMVKGENSLEFYALPVCEDELAEQLIEYCKGFVQAYVEYTANYNALWAIQQFLVPDSTLYNELTQASSGMNWGHGVNAEITDIDVKNFVYYGNAITCETSYSMTRDDGDRSENMKLLLVKTNLGWRVISREVF